MKIIIRIFGLIVVGIVSTLIIMQSFEMNIYYDELVKISSLAMANTQIVMAENIEDKYHGTQNSRILISNNDEYINLYRDNLNKLINTNAKYTISDHYADYQKGLLYVKVQCEYRTINGKKKMYQNKLLNIIDVVEE